MWLYGTFSKTFFHSFRICSTIHRHTRAQSHCPGSQCRKWRQPQRKFKQNWETHPFVTRNQPYSWHGWPLPYSALFQPFSLVFFNRPKRPSGEEISPGSTIKKQLPVLPRRDARQIYNPPSGKYSATIGTYGMQTHHLQATVCRTKRVYFFWNHLHSVLFESPWDEVATGL